MTLQHDDDNQWEPCAGGEISGMLRGVQSRRHRGFALKVVGGTLVAILVGVLFVEFRPAANVNVGRISCKDVHAAAKDFLAGRIAGDEKERIAVHLHDCPPCAEMMRKMRNKSGNGSQVEPRSPRTVSLETPAIEFDRFEPQILLAGLSAK